MNLITRPSSSTRRRISGLLALAALTPAVISAPADPAAKAGQTDIPVKTVVLFSSGVGYFEHTGSVAGSASTELRFKTAQINDILKSLVLQDLDRGTVSTITYPSQDPIEKTLRSFQVDITNNPPLADLLNQLRGAKILVTIGTDKVAGTILGVEKKQKPVDKDKVIDVWTLNLIVGGTIRSLPLDDARSIQLEDAQLQEELNKALAALAQARDQDKKPVIINFRGEGNRRVRIGYVVETPVWKTSYRLGLASEGQKKPMLQGWAILENQTDNDWNGVQLSLVSGRPISFIQDLYQPLYVPRPVVQPELYSSLKPQTYDAGLRQQQLEGANQLAVMDAASAPQGRAFRGAAAKAANRGMDGVEAERLAAGGGLGDGKRDELRRSIDPNASIESVASAEKIGELFQYTIGSVSLPRQRSAMIPIINEEVEAEKISIYNQSVLAKNPLNGVRLKNTTADKKHLLQGPITVFDEDRYAGDARIDNVPPGQERLLSYGIDLQMRVDATKNKSDTAITTGRIVKGILHLSRKHLFTQDYVMENKADKDKAVIVEHPLRQGWKLVDTDKPIETTETLYRFKGNVAAGKSSKLTVKEELVQDETVAILPADIGQILIYSRSGEIPKDVRDVLAKAAALKQTLTDTQRLIDDRKKQIAQITAEQARIRENMKTVGDKAGEYYNRLLRKLNEQESLIEKLQGEIDAFQRKLEQQRKDLEDYLGSATVG